MLQSLRSAVASMSLSPLVSPLRRRHSADGMPGRQTRWLAIPAVGLWSGSQHNGRGFALNQQRMQLRADWRFHLCCDIRQRRVRRVLRTICRSPRHCSALPCATHLLEPRAPTTGRNDAVWPNDCGHCRLLARVRFQGRLFVSKHVHTKASNRGRAGLIRLAGLARNEWWL